MRQENWRGGVSLVAPRVTTIDAGKVNFGANINHRHHFGES